MTEKTYVEIDEDGNLVKAEEPDADFEEDLTFDG